MPKEYVHNVSPTLQVRVKDWMVQVEARAMREERGKEKAVPLRARAARSDLVCMFGCCSKESCW